MNNNFVVFCNLWLVEKKIGFTPNKKYIDKNSEEYKYKPKKNVIVSKKNTRKTCKKF